MSMRGRWIAFGAVLVIGAAGAWWYIDHRLSMHPDVQLHDTAAADAANKVDNVVARFDYDRANRADEFVHSAGLQPGVQVLSVAGESHWDTGVTLVLKVTGKGFATGEDGSVILDRDVPICFRLQLGPDDDSRDDDIDCPVGAPIPTASDPSLDNVDEALRSALKSVGPKESAVRAAVARLRLDPAVKQDVVAQDDVVGVALRASQYDCIVARVTAQGAELWRPSRIQLAPGELDCSAGLALGTTFGTTPH
ncbi:hypothetical protein [Actinoplanes sp. NPDC026623]|uniref:hypothetical protein n=1 Tax=Actinoplanes sp. NPDC026623 TaxID=3155610 RepID=UPI0033FDD639